jgi:hypothetical protein
MRCPEKQRRSAVNTNVETTSQSLAAVIMRARERMPLGEQLPARRIKDWRLYDIASRRAQKKAAAAAAAQAAPEEQEGGGGHVPALLPERGAAGGGRSGRRSWRVRRQ